MTGRGVNEIHDFARTMLEKFPFIPHPWLRRGHFQTIYGSQQRRSFPWGWSECSKDLVKLSGGAEVNVKYSVRDPALPTLLAIHGMSGSCESGYMQALSHKAYRRGWNFFLPSLYNVAVRPSSPKIFHAGSSDSIADLIDICTLRHRLQQIVVVGVSMGGNIVLKLLGEYGNDCPRSIRAAAVISPLVDLMKSWSVLDRPLNVLYRLYYLQRLRRLSMRSPEGLAPFIKLEELRKVRTIRQFDEVVTAPLAGFEDAFHYYREVSSIHLLPSIRLPTLLLHSKDDPLLPWEPLQGFTCNTNQFLHVHLTEKGGHAAFIGKRKRGDVDQSWAENRVIDFLQRWVSPAESKVTRNNRVFQG